MWSGHCLIEHRQTGEKSIPGTIMEPLLLAWLKNKETYRFSCNPFTFLDPLWLQLWLVVGVDWSLQRFAIFTGHQLICSCYSPPQSPPDPPTPPPPHPTPAKGKKHTKKRKHTSDVLRLTEADWSFVFLWCASAKKWAKVSHSCNLLLMYIFTIQKKSPAYLVFNILNWSYNLALMIEEEIETNWKKSIGEQR